MSVPFSPRRLARSTSSSSTWLSFAQTTPWSPSSTVLARLSTSPSVLSVQKRSRTRKRLVASTWSPAYFWSMAQPIRCSAVRVRFGVYVPWLVTRGRPFGTGSPAMARVSTVSLTWSAPPARAPPPAVAGAAPPQGCSPHQVPDPHEPRRLHLGQPLGLLVSPEGDSEDGIAIAHRHEDRTGRVDRGCQGAGQVGDHVGRSHRVGGLAAGRAEGVQGRRVEAFRLSDELRPGAQEAVDAGWAVVVGGHGSSSTRASALRTGRLPGSGLDRAAHDHGQSYREGRCNAPDRNHCGPAGMARPPPGRVTPESTPPTPKPAQTGLDTA